MVVRVELAAIDESPMAYKDTKEILQLIADTWRWTTSSSRSSTSRQLAATTQA